MTLHRVELTYSTTGAASFNAWLQTWLTNMEPWAEHPNEVPGQMAGDRSTEDRDGPYRGQLVFQWSEDKAIIRDQLLGYLSAYCSWSVLRYHVCTHDESERTTCGWDEVETQGSVPAEYDPTTE